MKQQYLLTFGCVISLIVLCAALYSEAVDAVAAFDFNTLVEWSEFRASMEFVEFKHFNLEAHDVLALVGMTVILLSAVFIRADIPRWGLIGYSVAYFAAGGFVGPLMIAFGGFLVPIDGEFFQDRHASLFAHGVWGYTLIILVFHQVIVRTKKPNKALHPTAGNAPV